MSDLTKPKPVSVTKVSVDEGLRQKLLDLSEAGKIDKKPAAIKKASQKTMEGIWENYQIELKKKKTKDLTTLIVTKVDLLVGYMDLGDSEELDDEILNHTLIMEDLGSLLEKIEIPYIGLIELPFIYLKQYWKHYAKKESDVPSTSNVE